MRTTRLHGRPISLTNDVGPIQLRILAPVFGSVSSTGRISPGSMLSVRYSSARPQRASFPRTLAQPHRACWSRSAPGQFLRRSEYICARPAPADADSRPSLHRLSGRGRCDPASRRSRPNLLEQSFRHLLCIKIPRPARIRRFGNALGGVERPLSSLSGLNQLGGRAVAIHMPREVDGAGGGCSVIGNWVTWSLRSLISGPHGWVCFTLLSGGCGSGCGLGFTPLEFGEQTVLII